MKEEEAQVGLGILPWHKMSLLVFLITGFELEDSQYVYLKNLLPLFGLILEFLDILFDMKQARWKE